jgi:hypothetical protein
VGLVAALRTYLRAFRLPGEAQQIDRILNAFAGVAHTSCREGALLASIDATYVSGEARSGAERRGAARSGAERRGAL